MFAIRSDDGYREILDKIQLKTLIHGKKTLMAEFRIGKGALLPRHNHPHEQIGYLVSGRLQLTIGEETRTVEAGDSWCVAGHVEHQAAALEDSVAVEVFSPVREDYLP